MSDSTTRPGSLPASPPPGRSPTLVYRPLSLLAVAGCAWPDSTRPTFSSAVWSPLCGAPWLQGAAGGLVPLAAAVLSMVGLVRIRRSEGTLAGEKVARWGLLLSILFGLGYWAYFGATYFAIAREADQFGHDFLDKLSRGEELDGFRLTLPPDARPGEGAGLRGQLEQRFNALNEQGRPGWLTSFRQDEKVRCSKWAAPRGPLSSRRASAAWSIAPAAIK